MTTPLTRLVVAALLLSVPPPAMAHDLYRCEVRDQVSPQNDGTFGRSDYDKIVVRNRSVIVVDTSTGMVRGAGTTGTWEIVQRGSTANSWLMLWRYEGGASVALQTISIRTWKEPVTFIWADNTFGHIATGLCAPVR